MKGEPKQTLYAIGASIGTLVKHKTLREFGVGIINEYLPKNYVGVKIGMEGYIIASESMLILVDMKGTRSISDEAFKANCELHKTEPFIIIDNVLNEWNGTFYIPIRWVTEKDFQDYKRLAYDYCTTVHKA